MAGLQTAGDGSEPDKMHLVCTFFFHRKDVDFISGRPTFTNVKRFV